MDYDTCKPGDSHSGPGQNETCPDEVGLGPTMIRFGCTREIGHAGQHVAEGTTRVLVVWASMLT